MWKGTMHTSLPSALLTSRSTSLDRLAWADKTSTSTRLLSIAATMAALQLSPALMLRGAIQQRRPASSNAPHSVSATVRSSLEWLMKTS